MSRDIKINIGSLNLSTIACGIVSSIDDVRDHNFIAKGLGSLPFPLQARIARKYIERYQDNTPKVKYKANRWFDRTIQKLKPRFNVLFSITQNMPLPWHILSNKDKTKNYSNTTAMECTRLLIETADGMTNESYEKTLSAAFEYIGEYTQTMQVSPDHWHKREKKTVEQIETAMLKLQCEKWWATKLKGVRARYLELLEIATGQVGKDLYHVKKTKKTVRRGISPYSSKQAQGEYIAAQKSGREYLDKLELQNDKGEVINLLQAVDAGMANPVNRRNELMLRMRETEELANEMNYIGIFYTMTCPSKYHANSDHWSGATPKDAQNYLVNTWARARAKLDRLGLDYFGIRVAEPHADACPHWHMMLFVPQNRVQWVTAILRKYFIAEDVEELRGRYGALTNKLKNRRYTNRTQNGLKVIYQEFSKPCRHNENRRILFKAYKQKRQLWGHKKSQGIKAKAPEKFYRTFAPRFTAVVIDPKKGSAAGYIAKYISKNIDGYKVHDHEDAETGESLANEKHGVSPVLAWASTWNIRQFQFQGSPSVTVYRELRRVREPVEQFDLERVRIAADQGQWKEFVKLMGGMRIGRNANFKTAYEETLLGNKYAETVKKIKGVATSTNAVAQALREMRGEVSVFEDATLLTRVTNWTKQLKGTAEKLAAQEQGFVGFADQSWTSGNNCTPTASGIPAKQRVDIKLGMLGLSDSQISALKNGKRVRIPFKEGQIDPIRDRVYTMVDHEIRTFTFDHELQQQKRAEIAHFATVHAIHHHFAQRIRLSNGEYSLHEYSEPPQQSWDYAREFVNTAFSHALNDGRNTPNDNDWQYARDVANGDIELDWWDNSKIA
jgi:hypothetical protein